MITREAIVAEALSWCSTPWHHEAHIKGVGVDCAQLLRIVLNNCGANIRPTDHYPRDWHLHREQERFMLFVLEHCVEIDEEDLLPGDMILWRFGRCFSHGGFFIGGTRIVHAIVRERITRIGDMNEGELGFKNKHPRRCFRWSGFLEKAS